MDRSLLVTEGHRFLDLLDDEGMRPEAALWVHDPDTDRWRLWLAPGDGTVDDRLFFRRVSTVLAAHPDLDLSTSDTSLVSLDHPAFTALRRGYEVRGRSSVSLSSNMLDGFFLTEGILLRMTRSARSAAA